MNELRLIFHDDPQADGFTVQIVREPQGTRSPAAPFDFSLSSNDYEDLRWYLEDFMDLPDGGAVGARTDRRPGSASGDGDCMILSSARKPV